MIPKFHKRPYKYRFIAGASNATTKRLAIDVNLCLKLIKKIHKGYCKSIYYRNGYNYFWSMDNSKEVLDKLNNVNNPSSIHTYDFSTLYTNLPLDLVRNELFEMIDRYFDINERKSNKYIVLNHFWETAQFASVNKKGSYDRDKLKTALDYLLFDSFVRFGPHVSRIRRNLSIHIARFSASESPRANTNTPKNPHFSLVAGYSPEGMLPRVRLRMRQHPKQPFSLLA